MGQVYDLCAVTRENALFFLDYSLASSMETDEHLSLKEFKVSLRHFKSVEDAKHQRRFESPALIYYSGSGNCCSARFVENVWVWISYKSGKLFLLSSDERCCNLSCSFNHPTTPSFAYLSWLRSLSLLRRKRLSHVQAELVARFPQMHIRPHDVCIMELRFIQLRQFNLFVPTAIEFAQCLIARLIVHATAPEALGAAAAAASPSREAGLGGSGRHGGGGGGGGDPAAAAGQALRQSTLQARAAQYLEYLELEFKNIEYRQSEKALAAVTCAIAHWSCT